MWRLSPITFASESIPTGFATAHGLEFFLTKSTAALGQHSTVAMEFSRRDHRRAKSRTPECFCSNILGLSQRLRSVTTMGSYLFGPRDGLDPLHDRRAPEREHLLSVAATEEFYQRGHEVFPTESAVSVSSNTYLVAEGWLRR